MKLTTVLAAGGFSLAVQGAMAADATGQVQGALLFAHEAEFAVGMAALSYLADDPGDDIDLNEFSHGLVEGDVRAAIPIGERFGLQFDAGGLATSAERDVESSPRNGNLHDYYYVAAHAAWRDPQSHALGVVAMFGDAFGGEINNSGNQADRGRANLVAIEAQHYRDRLTFYAQAGIWDAWHTRGDDDVMDGAWFVRGEVRAFHMDGSRTRVGLSYATGAETGRLGDCDTEDSCLRLDAVSWELRHDRTISENLSLFGAYKGAYVGQREIGSEGQCCEGIFEHSVLMGLHWQKGAGDFLTMDRYGVTFDTPDLGRWLGYTTEVVDTGN